MSVCHSMDVVQRNRSDRLRFSVYRHFYGMAERIVEACQNLRSAGTSLAG